MARIGTTVVGAICVGLLAACSSSTKTATLSAPPVSVAAPAPVAATTAPASAPATSAISSPPPTVSLPPAVSATGVPTALDPCQLVTSAEASALAGTSFGTGTEQAGGDSKQCIYGSQTTNVFTVEVAQATDAATAQADWSQEEAQAQAALKQGVPAGISVAYDTADVAGIGDRAATVAAKATISGQQIAISGIYVLKGATFFAFQDLVLGKSAPTAAALEAEAQTTLGRL